MKIGIVGTGYVGLVTGACFADMGNKVWCVDTDSAKIEALKNGKIPIYEPGLENIVHTHTADGRLCFTTDLKDATTHCEIIFIAVGTPMGEDGSADLQYVLAVAQDLGRLITRPVIIVNKSTVPVGTGAAVRAAVQKELDARKSDITFDVISNPEFLKEGSAVADCLKPDRIVIGTDNPEVVPIMRELYTPFILNSSESLIVMDIKSAEMTKYAANAMLATKISFINEIAGICERVGADVNKVRIGIGSDSRIGYQFIYPGCGYGGSCFPKDVQALIRTAQDNGYTPRLLNAVTDVNAAQKHVIPTKVKQRFGEDLKGLTFAVWGLAFKPDTDDMREAASITIINDLTSAGAKVCAYDPQAMKEAREFYLKDNKAVSYAKSKYDAANGADALILVTEWKEFRSPDFYELRERLKNSVIFDGRNQYDQKRMERYGFEYIQIGKGNV